MREVSSALADEHCFLAMTRACTVQPKVDLAADSVACSLNVCHDRLVGNGL